MLPDKIKKLFGDVRPHAEKLAFDAAKGYVFGCLFGVFVPSKKPLGCTMHENGKNFAKMSVAYSATEMVITKARGKDGLYNSVVAGAVAGAVGSKQGKFAGMCIFGAYSGLSHYLSRENKI